MPIFEYKCDKCNAEFERVVFGSDTRGIKCPECDSDAITKQMSATSFMGASIGTCAADAPKGFS
ncbi:MAG: zinc ribbon domain-containing protein [Desulfobacterales bacterium]|nr:zinc ribbon domain-containing protein [Desulfobacterales bacterium]